MSIKKAAIKKTLAAVLALVMLVGMAPTFAANAATLQLETLAPLSSSSTTYNIEQFTTMANRTYRDTSDLDSNPYGNGGPNVTPWEPNDKANTGATYDSGIKIGTGGSWSVARFAVDYFLGGKCQTFTGTFVIHEDAKNNNRTYYIRIYGDGNELWVSEQMTAGSMPQPFSVSVSGVTKLTIDAKVTDNNAQFYNYQYIGLVDAVITSTDPDVTSQKNPATKAGTKLESLVPMTIRTYRERDDADSDTYGSGMKNPIEWEPHDRANTNGQYDSGARLGTGGSWTVERFAYDYAINRAYSNFSGVFATTQNNKSNTTQYYIRIYGDGTELWRSGIMGPGALPQAFSVNTSGVTKLTIEFKTIDGSSFYNYDSIAALNAVLGDGGAAPAPTPPVEWPKQAPPTGAVTAHNIELFTPLANRTYSGRLDAYDNTYGYGGPNVTPWGPDDKSNTGATYNSGIKIGTGGSWSVGRFAVDYFLNERCTVFAGSFVIHDGAKNASTVYYIRIFGDGKELWLSPLMSAGTLPQPFSVNVSGVEVLTIEAKVTNDNAKFYNYQYIGVVNAAFYSADPDPMTPKGVVAFTGTKIESLTPTVVRTHSGRTDPDSDTYYGSRAPVAWQPTDRANTNGTYDSGVKLGVGSSWNIGRFAYEYTVNKAYKNFSGIVALTQNVKSSTTQYYVRILGDGVRLWTSKMMGPGTLPQPFSVDISNVTTLTIECRTIEGDTFYNYDSVAIVNAVLGKGDAPDPFEDAHDWAKGNLAKADEAGIIPDSFKAAGWRASTSRLTVVDAIVEMLEGAGISRDAYAAARGWDLSENPFPDVTGNKNLTFLQKAGVVSGTRGTDGIYYYRPSVTHTRREAAVIVGNIAEKFFGVANVRGSNPFTDVPNSHWSAPYLGYAADNNIVEGNLRADGTRTFNPSGTLTNEATIVLMLNAFNHFKSK